MRLEKWFDTIFSVISSSNQKDAGGALTPTTTTKLSNQNGNLNYLSGNKAITNGKGEVIANYLLICAEISILESDQIKITSNPNSSMINKIFDIQSIDFTTLRGRNPHLEIFLLLRT